MFFTNCAGTYGLVYSMAKRVDYSAARTVLVGTTPGLPLPFLRYQHRLCGTFFRIEKAYVCSDRTSVSSQTRHGCTNNGRMVWSVRAGYTHRSSHNNSAHALQHSYRIAAGTTYCSHRGRLVGPMVRELSASCDVWTHAPGTPTQRPTTTCRTSPTTPITTARGACATCTTLSYTATATTTWSSSSTTTAT